MSLKTFLHDLYYDLDKVNPLDEDVDWSDAPLEYKLYRGLPVVPLSAEVPLTLEAGNEPVRPDLRGIGYFLWYVFGLTQSCQSLPSMDGLEQGGGMTRYRRFVPSGGALYPCELYVYLKVAEVPTGIYHYDAAHHRLVLLREGNFDSYLARSLGLRCDVSACFATVFVSTMFWKNFFKYKNFSCRLQGLDTGGLIGQLLEVAKRFGFETGVYYQFLDRAVNHLLGLSGEMESVCAMIPLSVESDMTWFSEDNGSPVADSDLCSELPEVVHEQYIRSRNVKEYSMLRKMNEASWVDTTQSFRTLREKQAATLADSAVKLPKVERCVYDLASVSRKRFSPENRFVQRKISHTQLAMLLHEAVQAFSYRNDLDGPREGEHRVSLSGCLHGVDGIADGAYRYDSAGHLLRQVCAGDLRMHLQQAMTLHNISLFQVPVCLHVEGERDHLTAELGFRGHRIQLMEVGMLMQRVLLAAAALGMGGHPLLGFDVSACDQIYGMAARGRIGLLQIPVGFHHPSPRLEGGLHG